MSKILYHLGKIYKFCELFLFFQHCEYYIFDKLISNQKKETEQARLHNVNVNALSNYSSSSKRLPI